LPAGSTIRTAYVPLGEPGSRLSSTRGNPANRGETNLDTGSAGAGTAAARLGAGSLTLGRGASVGRARSLPAVPCAARGGALLSTGGARLSPGAAALAASREGSGDASSPAGARAGAWATGFSAPAGPLGAGDASGACADGGLAGPGACGEARCPRLCLSVSPAGDSTTAAAATAAFIVNMMGMPFPH